MDALKVTVTIDDKKITLEGPADFVKAEVARLTAPLRDSGAGARTLNAAGDGNVPRNEREMIEAKSPKGHHEIIVVLAFWLAESGQSDFGPEDMRRAYIRANIRPPKVIEQALRDAKNKFDYLQQAEAKGRYRLTRHGENVVRFDLPRR